MLVICCTPLQTLVARAMLESRKIRRFRLIYFTWVDNDKQRHYYERLANIAEKSAFVHFNSRFPVHLVRFIAALRSVAAGEGSSIAFAAINNIYVQFAIRWCSYRTVITFDDGTTNISRESMYFVPREQGVAKTIGARMLRGGRDERWVRLRSERHYTIYPGLDNIVPPERLVPVHLSNDLYRSAGGGKGVLRVFIGQPMDDFFDPEFPKWYIRLVHRLKIDEYLPHPRESIFPVGVHIAKTRLIAEDYILSQLEKFARVEIFGISSAALLNIESDCIARNIIVYQSAPRQLMALYPLFERRGCVLLNEFQV